MVLVVVGQHHDESEREACRRDGGFGGAWGGVGQELQVALTKAQYRSTSGQGLEKGMCGLYLGLNDASMKILRENLNMMTAQI